MPRPPSPITTTATMQMATTAMQTATTTMQMAMTMMQMATKIWRATIEDNGADSNEDDDGSGSSGGGRGPALSASPLAVCFFYN